MGLARYRGSRGEGRSSALWGTGNRGSEGRSRRGARVWALALCAVGLAAPLAATAGALTPSTSTAGSTTFVAPPLLEAAQRDPSRVQHVIVVAQPGVRSGTLKNELMKDAAGNQFGRVRREFKYVLDGVAADLTGRELLLLASKTGVKSITPDGPVRTSGYTPGHVWQTAVGATPLWTASMPALTPTIAVVDTGVDKDRVADFGGRVLATVNFSSLKPDPSDSNADYSGHGTLVAGIAAGASSAYRGVAPKANIVSLRVTNGEGKAVTSDVIAAADWIYENRGSYNIRVANFSVNSPFATYGLLDPLNEAVRRLWLTGTVVVAAAGNDGPGATIAAPASEPFVITVGATDVAETAITADDTNAPWSSHGHTTEGFAKPELAAPGRYIAGPIARTSRLVNAFPHRVISSGYMWMSGTSFAAPVVSGAAAQILAMNPSFKPDQVKGALMATARALPLAAPGSVGVGQIDAAAAASLATPPNPNSPLLRFLKSDSRVPGGRVFDTELWAATAQSDPNWFSASWSDVSWSDASWSDVSWSDVSWSDVSWSDASWSDASWSDASWSDASWSDASWSDASWADASWTD
jgi:serine protease AprX